MIILDGKKVSNKKLLTLKEKVSKLNRKLGLAIIEIGDNKESKIYINQKKKIALYLNYNCQIFSFDEQTPEENIINKIKELNNDNNIDGIIVELPIPKKYSQEKIINAIIAEKDIDCLTNKNIAKLNNNTPYLLPCTPKGLLDLLDYYKITLKNKNITIIGKSILVGTPLYNILKNNNISVNLLDSKTENITNYTLYSDIIIIAIGKKQFLKNNMIKKDTIIIDVGINYYNGHIYGDVDYESVKENVSYITPVPGGVGPMTIYELMDNIYLTHKKRK